MVLRQNVVLKLYDSFSLYFRDDLDCPGPDEKCCRFGISRTKYCRTAVPCIFGRPGEDADMVDVDPVEPVDPVKPMDSVDSKGPVV